MDNVIEISLFILVWLFIGLVFLLIAVVFIIFLASLLGNIMSFLGYNPKDKVISNFVYSLNSSECEKFFNKYSRLFRIQNNLINDYAYKDKMPQGIQVFFNRFNSVSYQDINFNKNFELRNYEYEDYDEIKESTYTINIPHIVIGRENSIEYSTLLDSKHDEIIWEYDDGFPHIVTEIYIIFVHRVLTNTYKEVKNPKRLERLLHQEYLMLK